MFLDEKGGGGTTKSAPCLEEMGIFHERSGSTSGEENGAVGAGGAVKTHKRRDSWLAQVRHLFSPTPSTASSDRSDVSRGTASPLAQAVGGLRLGDDSGAGDVGEGMLPGKGPVDTGIETDIFLWEACGGGRAGKYLNKEVQAEPEEEALAADPPTAIPNGVVVDRTYSPIPASFHQHHARKKAAISAAEERDGPTVTLSMVTSGANAISLPELSQPVGILKDSPLANTAVDAASPKSSASSNLSTSPSQNSSISPSSNRTLSRRKKHSSGERHIRFSNFACLLDAAWQGDLEEVRKMIEEKDVSPDACNADGVTALHCAAASANYAMVEYLLEAGANANVADDHGWTPLHSAAYNNHQETVELLLAYGADVEALDSQGQTPISLPTDIEMIRTFGEIVSRKNSAEWLVALYDFCGEDVENAEGDELDFGRGDRLRILRRDDANWWLAEREDGSALGYIPRQFIQ